MARISFKGMDEYVKRLERLTDDTDEAIEKAVDAGVNVLADAVRAALNTIPTHGDKEHGSPKNPLVGLTAQEKADLLAGYGVAPIRKDGDYINRKVGFHGYGSKKTKKYPQGVPNSLIARSLESGTSWRQKSPVIRQAVNRVKKQAEDAMKKELENQINSLMN